MAAGKKGQFDASQIEKYLAAFVRTSSIAIPALASNSITITTAITTALLTGGEGGRALKNQLYGGSNEDGIIGSFPFNRVRIYDDTTGHVLADISGNVVYGRITRELSAWKLALFVRNNGVEQPYAFGVIKNVKLDIPYVFTFDLLPVAAFLYDDDWFTSFSSGGGGGAFNGYEIEFTIGAEDAPAAGIHSVVLTDCNGTLLTNMNVKIFRERRRLYKVRDYTYNDATAILSLVAKTVLNETFLIDATPKALWTYCKLGAGPAVPDNRLMINNSDGLLINGADRFVL